MTHMAFTLHGAPLSPFVRKVMYLLTLSKTPYSLKVVVPGSVPDSFVIISPLKRIPVLQEGDWCQADSSIICNYLIESLDHNALTQLIPTSAKSRARMRWLEKFADYELAPKLTFTVFRQRVLQPALGKVPDEELIQKALSQNIPPLLTYLENQLGGQDYFVDNCFSLADIAITSQMVNFMHAGETINQHHWPMLSVYFERMLAQPIWQTLVQREQVTLNKILAAQVTP
jgi:glutathione S-transferase